MGSYSSDEIKESVSFEDLDITFGSKVEDLENGLKPLEEKGFNYTEFKNLFKAKVEFVGGGYWYPFDQKVYEFLRPFIPHFPFTVGISAIWCYYESMDMVFHGNTFWDSDTWKEENEGEELPEDFLDLLYFDDDETANPHEWLQDCDWVTDHEEEVKEWFTKRLDEEGEEYDEDNTYDNFKRFWQEFKDAFPEAWKSFKDHVSSI